ncbi:hypothetical protein O3P69_003837 [Scylla paramamosain]|uniref:Uncharacterized protein n=1 Tax=Scylla paramamosain TaxID=85552 RepID=A0AAW0UDS9_SCYPA
MKTGSESVLSGGGRHAAAVLCGRKAWHHTGTSLTPERRRPQWSLGVCRDYPNTHPPTFLRQCSFLTKPPHLFTTTTTTTTIDLQRHSSPPSPLTQSSDRILHPREEFHVHSCAPPPPPPSPSLSPPPPPCGEMCSVVLPARVHLSLML